MSTKFNGQKLRIPDYRVSGSELFYESFTLIINSITWFERFVNDILIINFEC